MQSSTFQGYKIVKSKCRFCLYSSVELTSRFWIAKDAVIAKRKNLFFSLLKTNNSPVFPFTNYHKWNLHTLMYLPSNVCQTTVSLSSICQVASPFTIHPPRPTTTNSGPAATPRGAQTPYIYTHKYAFHSRSSYHHIASSKVCSVSCFGNGHGR